MKTLSVRIDQKEDDDLELLSKKMKTEKSSVARKALELGIRELKKAEAIEKVRTRKWTVWRAAEYCGLSYRSFIQLLRTENVPFPLSLEEFQSELNESN
ncbi:MAG: UPF0175 family protein [Candidatus Heimdallarchaeaceae archaeon]